MKPTAIRACPPRGATSSARVRGLARTATALATVAVQLACASAGGKRADAPATPPTTSTAAGGGGTGVPNTDAKSVETLFAGRFPGVTVTAADGGGLQIRIRGGGNTIYGGNEPLYLVDDSPLPPGTGGLVLLNPYDIEKIEVLKNPADIVVYGARGANGVVKITTTRPGRR